MTPDGVGDRARDAAGLSEEERRSILAHTADGSDRLHLLAAVERIKADAVDAALAEVERLTEELRLLRQHKISDPTLHALHENAKAYSLAVQALNKKRGGPLSTTLAHLIENDYLIPNDPRSDLRGEIDEARTNRDFDRAYMVGLNERAETAEAEVERQVEAQVRYGNVTGYDIMLVFRSYRAEVAR